ncbi:hypothetical protein [Cohnella thailandensis]|uniref:Uncharacterized protein n=1 Tax=Cohnella thailandensis TaxID=557557 RepID=A0A841SR33_9BACL|nr:hypothetical protein [Cohnella thailandensis]MBB6632608.1 hypothetical protein [Cohnella thailandensis]MBP1975705.1 hypothetical protein [Cohnella thailandensis]
MRATEDVLRVWSRFNDFPMETLTKAWYSTIDSARKQRTVDLMKEHREKYGTSGNCFDLAIWLIDEFKREKLDSYAVLTPDSHVAVVVRNGEGNKYLCELGDQWIEPILMDKEHEDYSEEYLKGFFPGADIKLNVHPNKLMVAYRRLNGKESRQEFRLNPVRGQELMEAGQKTQRIFYSPLVEKRIFQGNQVLHWEFDNYSSMISSNEGLKVENPLSSIEEWADRIQKASGIDKEIVKIALEVYSGESSKET